MELRPFDGIVRADVQIGDIFGIFDFAHFRYADILFRFGRKGDVRLSYNLSFFHCFESELASIHIRGRAAGGDETHRNKGKLGGCAAAHE